MSDTTEIITIYKGKGLYKSKHRTNARKYFVFDLDETIGSFSEMYILFKCLQAVQEETNIILYDSLEGLLFSILDEFPEFFRYGTSILFKYLNSKKELYSNIFVYIYTNNACIPISWTTIIIKYIEYKWNIRLFDNIIRCFKIKDHIVEYNRTTNDKTFNDLMNCVKLPDNIELCFIDNTLFPKMQHRHVYYLRPKPYYHYVNRNDILKRFLNSTMGLDITKRLNMNTPELLDKVQSWYIENNYNFDTFSKQHDEMETDIEVSKKMFYHCRLFFYITTKKINTRKNNRKIILNKTKKNYHK